MTTTGAPSVPLDRVRTPGGEPGILVEELDAADRCWRPGALTDRAHLVPMTTTPWRACALASMCCSTVPVRTARGGAGRGAPRAGRRHGHRLAEDRRRSRGRARIRSYANPESRHRAVREPAARAVRVEVDAQDVDADAYGRFVRVHLRHRAPGPSIDEELDAAVAAATAADAPWWSSAPTLRPSPRAGPPRTSPFPAGGTSWCAASRRPNPAPSSSSTPARPCCCRGWTRSPPSWWWLPGRRPGALAAVLTGGGASGRLPGHCRREEADVPVPHGRPQGGYIDYAEGVDVGRRGWTASSGRPRASSGTAWATGRGDTSASSSPRGGGHERHPPLPHRARHGRSTPASGTPRGRAGVPRGTGGDPERPVRWLAGFAGRSRGRRAANRRRADRPQVLRDLVDGAGRLDPPTGSYRVRAGRSSRDLRLAAPHTVAD